MPSGSIEFRRTPSDDGKYAILEFVAHDREALARILSDPRTLKAFDFRKDFALEQGKKP